MIDAKIIRNELNEIRYFNLKKKEFAPLMDANIQPVIAGTAEKYNRAISKAPIQLFHIYIGLYVKGYTQLALSSDIGLTEHHVQKLNKKIVRFLQENLEKEEAVC